MKFRILIVAAVIAIAFYCSAVFAAPAAGGDKIGLVNIQKIMMESRAGKEAKASFEREIESKRSVLSAKEKSTRAIEEDLKATGAKLKADARKAKEEKLAEEIKELRRMNQDMQDELKKKDTELTSKILKEIMEITRKVSEERGYSMVMQIGPQIVYAAKANDITDEVLKRYDSGK